MSEFPEDVPALSVEASAFLKRHASSGEASAEQLARVKGRLPRRAASSVRSWVALAAGLALLGAAALGVYAARSGPGEANAPVVTTPVTTPLLVPQPPEPPVPQTTLVNEPRSPSAVAQDAVPLKDPSSVYLRAYQLMPSDPAMALRLFQQVVDEADPGSPLYLKAKARVAELGGGARPQVPPVSVKSPSDDALRELYLRAYQLRDANPGEAGKLFRQIVEKSKPGTSLHEKARARLEELSGPRADPTDFLDDAL